MLSKWMRLSLAMLFALGLTLGAGTITGCAEEESPTEETQDAAGEMQDAAEEAADEAGDAAEEAGDQVEDAVDY